ncbi:MAG: hypothetical protein ACRDYV_00015 [Acidimicrobiia bacterium]
MSPPVAQRLALASPCLLSVETFLPRFTHRIPGGSVVLTVNSGYE